MEGGSNVQGVVYVRSMNTGWKPPAKIRMQSEDQRQAVREKFHIIVDGHNLPPAVTEFRDTKLPPAVLRVLERKGIKKPTPIQMQVLPLPGTSDRQVPCFLDGVTAPFRGQGGSFRR